MLRMRLGLCCLTAVKAIVSMAEKLRQACMKTCSSPLTLRWFRRSHSLALVNTLSMQTRLLKSLTKRLTPRATKSRPIILSYCMPNPCRVVLVVSHNSFEVDTLGLQFLQ